MLDRIQIASLRLTTSTSSTSFCPLPPSVQFRHVLSNFLLDTFLPSPSSNRSPACPQDVKHIPPYWLIRTAYARKRWLGMTLVDMLSDEFRGRSRDYYKYAIQSGMITLNNQIVTPDRIIRPSDRFENVIHFHERPITSVPIKILHHNHNPDFLVVDKPAGVPVHPTGAYFRNTLIHILKHTHQFTTAITINRLDRLVSGLLIIPLNVGLAWRLMKELKDGEVKKEYVARVWGMFPGSNEKVTCELPLLTIDKKLGKNVIHKDGKPAKTMFTLVRYDACSNTSVVYCRPITGRTHQIRLHLQRLGHPIVNDRIYSEHVAGDILGETMEFDHIEDVRLAPESQIEQDDTQTAEDADADFTPYRTLVAHAKSLLQPPKPLPPTAKIPLQCPPQQPPPSQREIQSSLSRLSSLSSSLLSHSHSSHTSCPKCYIPVHRTPSPKELFICLHAWRYTTSLGCFESGLPVWAQSGWDIGGNG